MRTTIDAAGRVVLPADVRDALGLAAGSEVDLVLIDARHDHDRLDARALQGGQPRG